MEIKKNLLRNSQVTAEDEFLLVLQTPTQDKENEQNIVPVEMIGQKTKHITCFQNRIVRDCAPAIYPIRSHRILTIFAPWASAESPYLFAPGNLRTFYQNPMRSNGVNNNV